LPVSLCENLAQKPLALFLEVDGLRMIFLREAMIGTKDHLVEQPAIQLMPKLLWGGQNLHGTRS
jgi:hypothetical protein